MDNRKPNKPERIEIKKAGKSKYGLELRDAVQCFPTPTARDYKGAGLKIRGKFRLNEDVVHIILQDQTKQENGKQSSKQPHTSRPRLNPVFVEWLMGFPLWWTHPEPPDSAPSETQ
jgi:hypothetical protein